jgi:hypothetical protein
VGQPILAAAGFPAGAWTRWKACPQARLPAPLSTLAHCTYIPCTTVRMVISTLSLTRSSRVLGFFMPQLT